jgi:hypothetical protein
VASKNILQAAKRSMPGIPNAKTKVTAPATSTTFSG